MAEKQTEQGSKRDGSNQPSRGAAEPAASARQEGGRRAAMQPAQATDVAAPAAYLSPFTLMRRMAEEMDSVFEEFGFPRTNALFSPIDFGSEELRPWSPQIEVFERSGELVVRADLPGLARNDVRVRVNGDALTIEGERRREDESASGNVYRSERSYGRFTRVIPLPEGVDAQSVIARFDNGVLEVTMKAPGERPAAREVAIKSNDLQIAEQKEKKSS